MARPADPSQSADSEASSTQTQGRRTSYAVGEPDSAPELIRFVTCDSIEEVQAIDPQDLYEAARQGQATLEEWEADIVDYVRTIKELEAKIRTKEGIISYLEQREASPAPHTLKEIDIPVPELSDGDTPTFENWKAQIEGKFDINQRLFPTKRSKIVYLFGKTTGDAQTHLSARHNDTDDRFATAQEMIEHLATIYIDPHKTLNARTDFKKLIMRPSSTLP